MYLYIFITSPYHIFKSNIPTAKTSLCSCYLFCSPLHLQAVYTACLYAPFPDSDQIGFEAKAPNSSRHKAKGFNQQRVQHSPLVLQDLHFNTATYFCPLFLHHKSMSRSSQLSGGEDSWLSSLPMCLPASRPLFHALISCLQPRKLEKDISAWQTIAGAVPPWLAAPRAPLYPDG